jgi:formate dehydrogenase subunit beta
MSDALKISKGIEQGLREFFEFLLKSGKVGGVFALKKMNDKEAVSYSLITDTDELKDVVPLYPLMPVNAGKALSSFTLEGVPEKPVAAVLRPCELRAFIELVKRNQGSLDNILLISLTCAGVYPLKSLTNGSLKKLLPQYWESVKKADIDPGIRDTCQSCENFIPQLADMTVVSLGKKNLDKECTIVLNTEKGEEYAREAPGSIISEEVETAETKKLKEKRNEKNEKMLEDFQKNGSGLKALIKTFASCLGCHGCSQACPICYCTLCDFDSKTQEYNPLSFSSELKQKGGLRVPPGTLYFHLGRMSHMAVSCVSCGMCSDVCPVNIPVSTLFSVVGASLQEVFGYIPGRDVEETVPSGTYKEEEFAEIGEQTSL